MGDLIMRLVITMGVVGLLTAPAPGLLAGEESPAEKAAADWLYPGAKVIDSGQGGAVSSVVQETMDDAAKVLKHYGDKVGIELQEEAAIQTGIKASPGGASVEYAHVGRKATGGTATVSTFKTKTAVATVVISRPQDGKVTTITVTLVPQGAAK
jgi:hypothetical protein